MADLREALEAAVTEQEKVDEATDVSSPAENTPVESVVTEAAEVPEPESGDDSAGEAVPAEKDAQSEKPAVDQKAETPLAPGQHRVDRAPASWKKEAKGEWATVPLHIRQEVHRREMEISRALNEAAQARQQAEQFNQVVTPYMARIQTFGVSPQQAVAQLLQADHALATGTKSQRAQLMAKLVKDYDVDISELDAALVGSIQQQQPESPDIQALVQQQLQQALAPIYQQQQAAAARQQQEVDQTVEQMALDPKYPLFDEVRQDMADIIEMNAKRGIAISLHDAYNKAVIINPQAQQAMQQQSAAQQANQQHLHAQRAKAASLSVSGAPASGGSNQFAGDGSLRGSIEAAFSNLRA